VIVSTRFVAWILASLAALTPTSVLLADTPEQSAPTAIEQALIENGCVGVLPRGALDSESYRECLRARLLALRADFGRDLEQLTRAERKQLDATCTGLRAAGREAYLDCLDAQLTSLHARRTPAANPLPQVEVPAPAPVIDAQANSRSALERQSSSSALVIGATLGLVIAVVGGARFIVKTRRPPRTCRQCGTELEAAGDLCAMCRREAAELRRRTATEQRSPENGEALGAGVQELSGEHQIQSADALLEDGCPVRVEDENEDQRNEAEAEHEPATDEQETVVSPPVEKIADHAVEPVPVRVREALFDPYVVLGIMPGATRDEVRTAYEDAKSKFDPKLVSHLSSEVQKHFKARSSALERAYQLLT